MTDSLRIVVVILAFVIAVLVGLLREKRNRGGE